MINLFDWMQAFIAIVQGIDENEEDEPIVKKKGKIVRKKKQVDEKLQYPFFNIPNS